MSASSDSVTDRSTQARRVLVVGAIHVDLVVSADRLPGPGETVVGSELVSHGGGKGANAALAARRSGAEVTLLGAVGQDEHADVGLEDLRAAGVDVESVQRVPEHTGTAVIVVDRAGENQIAVAPGAGAALNSDRVAEQVRARRHETGCVLVSTEVAADAVAAAVQSAAAGNVMCVLNTAPPYPGIVDLLELGPILSPNAGELLELDRLASAQGDSPADSDLVGAAARLAKRTAAPVVVTLGPDGALIVGADGEIQRVEAPEVDARDTTGAGDTFNGVLAARLAAAVPLLEAVRIAVVAASMSVREAGARAGMPTADALEAELHALPINTRNHA